MDWLLSAFLVLSASLDVVKAQNLALEQPQLSPELVCGFRCMAKCLSSNSSIEFCRQTCLPYSFKSPCTTDSCRANCDDLGPPRTLASPPNLRSSKQSGGNDLLWDPVSGDVVYVLLYKIASAVGYDTNDFIVSRQPKLTNFVPPKLSICNAFDARVSAFSADGAAPFSSVLRVSPPSPQVNPKLSLLDTEYLNRPFVSDFYEANGTLRVNFHYDIIYWPPGEKDLEVTPLFHLIACAKPDLSQGYPLPEFMQSGQPQTLSGEMGADLMYRECRFVYYLQSARSRMCGTSSEMHSPPPDALQTMTIKCDSVRNAPCTTPVVYAHPACGQVDGLNYAILNENYDLDDVNQNLTLNVSFNPMQRANEGPTLYYVGIYGDALNYKTQEEETFLGVNITRLIGSVSSCLALDRNGFCEMNTPNNSLVVSGIQPKHLYGITVCAVKDPRNLTFPDVMSQSRAIKPKANRLMIMKKEVGKNHAGMIVGIVLGSLAALASLVVAVLFYLKRKHRKQEKLYKLKIAQIEREKQNRYTDFPKKHDIWEIERRNLIIHNDKKLGSGAFGAVYLGKLIGKSLGHKDANSPLGINLMRAENCQVAIKMLPEYADDMSKSEFLMEISLMKSLGYHERLVNMLACITDSEPLCLVVEYCSDGDLLQFLRERCKYMMKLDELGINYHEAPEDDNFDLDMIVTLKQLLQFAVQISYGLEYLSQKGFVHRDVAARNVLVHDGNICKIGDFGLCRYIYGDTGQYKSKGGRLPLKWMSPESIRNYEFSIKSDVWSFGILLFEIITLGGSPYPGIAPEDMLTFLENGGRIEQPDNCPQNFYSLMEECWQGIPEERPEFSDIRQKLASQLEEITEDYSYLKLDAAKDYYNVQYDDHKDVVIVPESGKMTRISRDSLPVDDSFDGSEKSHSTWKSREDVRHLDDVDVISIDARSLNGTYNTQKASC
ncbi:unnamed protein product [Caenorhabditis auriculariae]|uniref:Protein kinase domain-containing protein n=1 Tax=Caenorhabditis auriculariae TaxID=2777116 RepID=A0A8S1GV34_9PELO|nr:unnamed protein product [Caenorhabditis auriculariae]